VYCWSQLPFHPCARHAYWGPNHGHFTAFIGSLVVVRAQVPNLALLPHTMLLGGPAVPVNMSWSVSADGCGYSGLYPDAQVIVSGMSIPCSDDMGCPVGMYKKSVRGWCWVRAVVSVW
jgi:hypothetical protein